MSFQTNKFYFTNEKSLKDFESEDNNSLFCPLQLNQENIIEDYNYFPYKSPYETKSTLNGELSISLIEDVFSMLNEKSNLEEYYHQKIEKENENDIQTPNKNVLIKKNKKIQFRTSIDGQSKRGRIPRRIPKKKHTKTAFDNLQRKIQVSYISFIINFSNDVLSFYYHNNKNAQKTFKHISHSIKKEISFKSCDNFKNLTIKDILQFDISKKYKKYKNSTIIINENQKLLTELCTESESEWFYQYFNMKYLNFFKYYYNKGRPFKNIKLNGKIITLSKKTKTFYDLLQKYKDDKTKLIETASSVYFNGYDTLIGKDSFRTEKIIYN